MTLKRREYSTDLFCLFTHIVYNRHMGRIALDITNRKNTLTSEEK